MSEVTIKGQDIKGRCPKCLCKAYTKRRAPNNPVCQCLGCGFEGEDWQFEHDVKDESNAQIKSDYDTLKSELSAKDERIKELEQELATRLSKLKSKQGRKK
jgi:hypothetical protein